MSRPILPPEIDRESVEQRFWANVDKSGPTQPHTSTPCWIWVARRHYTKGYGVLNVAGRQIETHRLSWVLEHGEIPAGLSVLHSCDEPRCVRPDHLRVGTHRDNMQDVRDRGRMAGERAGRAIATWADVHEIRRRAMHGQTVNSIAALWAPLISRGAVANIVQRVTWNHGDPRADAYRRQRRVRPAVLGHIAQMKAKAA